MKNSLLLLIFISSFHFSSPLFLFNFNKQQQKPNLIKPSILMDDYKYYYFDTNKTIKKDNKYDDLKLYEYDDNNDFVCLFMLIIYILYISISFI
jgi:hypothetical protein